jgi:hypothetical protein
MRERDGAGGALCGFAEGGVVFLFQRGKAELGSPEVDVLQNATALAVDMPGVKGVAGEDVILLHRGG